MDWQFVCPVCKTALASVGEQRRRCPACEREYACVAGVWRLLPVERLEAYSRFAREYQTIRQAEGRGSFTSAYYRALPFEDLSGRMNENWAIRARSFQTLLAQVIGGASGLCILDLGAGNGWLSYRLAEQGHSAAAVDLLINPFDGLGAHAHYPVRFTPVQAEFDALPFADEQADLTIFNASLHYSVGYENTLGEALRVLRTGGRVVILDSPIYHDRRSGEQMVREREAQFTQRYGFASNALCSENFLTWRRLDELAAGLGMRWEAIRPDYGVRWRLRRWVARLRGGREPAEFVILVGKR